MNGKGMLVVAIILMCVGFGNVIRHVATEGVSGQPHRPPSPVSAPPSEPAPAQTVAPQLTSDEQAYAATIANHADILSETFTELAGLMANPQIGNDEWTLNVATQLAIIRLLYDEAIGISPPSSMANIHQKYVQAMSHFEAATNLIAQGIDELDPDLIDQATQELLSGNQLINEATQLTDEFTRAHSR